jgi:predicted Rossmann-fold nucleotide-binding protein
MHAKPVIVLDDGSFYQPLWAYLTALADRGFVRATALERLVRVSRVEDAFDVLDRTLVPDRGDRGELA